MAAKLVTIGVVSYNSSNYILETLDSIKNQTYKNIEIIISDDGSSDDTVMKSEQWLQSNRERFQYSEIITVDKNTGVASNCNRVVTKANGEWLKMIAGDDVLLPNCIEEYMKYSERHPHAQWISSYIMQYRDTFESKNILPNYENYWWNRHVMIYEKSAKEQLQKIIYGNFISAPATIIQIETLRSIGGYVNAYHILEDFPTYIKLLESGVKCYFCKKILVNQRVSTTNICSNTQRLFNIQLRRLDYRVTKDMCFKYFSFRDKCNYCLKHYNMELMDMIGLNHNNKICRYLYRLANYVIKIVTL